MNPLQYITRAILINEFTGGQHSPLLTSPPCTMLCHHHACSVLLQPIVQDVCSTCCIEVDTIDMYNHKAGTTEVQSGVKGGHGLSAGHWQNKLYPYGGTGQTLGDGIMRSIDLPVDYWWCWLAIGVCIAYILLLNVIIVVLLTVLPGLLYNRLYHLLFHMHCMLRPVNALLAAASQCTACCCQSKYVAMDTML